MDRACSSSVCAPVQVNSTLAAGGAGGAGWCLFTLEAGGGAGEGGEGGGSRWCQVDVTSQVMKCNEWGVNAVQSS